MKTNELRIGVYVMAFDRPHIIKGYSPVDIWEQAFEEDTIVVEPLIKKDKHDSGCSTSIESVQGIPITEEWLKKFGFKKTERIDGNTDYSDWEYCGDYQHPFQIRNWIKGDTHFVMQNRRVGFWHIHELQNIYFALWGEELTIK